MLFVQIQEQRQSLQEVTQSAGTTPNEADVINSNLSSPSCVDMSKKIKKKKKKKKKKKEHRQSLV
jgi:lysine/ornithine N-monooxygenase